MTRTLPWLCLAVCMAPTALGAPLAYVAVPIGSLGGQSTYGTGINASGQISGWGDTDASGAIHRHAFLYSGGLGNLGTLSGGTQSFGYAINAAGQVAGSSNAGGVAQLHAVVFSAGTIRDLNPLLGGTISNAYAINAAGDVAGAFGSGGALRAYLYRASSNAVTDLGTLGGTLSQAYAINVSGDVTGYAHVRSSDAHAFRYGSHGIVDLGTLGGKVSIGHGINAADHVVGEASLAGDAGPHAFFHDGARMFDLGTLGGTLSRAWAINSADTVVGEAADATGASRAFVYAAGAMIDLNGITSGLNGVALTTATAVNDAGQIVAMSCTATLVCPQAFRLDPVIGPDLDQHGLTGSWYQPVTSGQGIELEVFPDLVAPGTGFLQGAWFTFDAPPAGGADRQRWYTFSGNAQSGKPNVPVTIYRNVGGNFNAGPITTAQPVGTGTITFSSCSAATFDYTFSDGSGRAGSIALTRLLPNVTCTVGTTPTPDADFSFSGNWFDPSTSGQGIVVELNPVTPFFFLTWYTYAVAGQATGAAGQRWYTAQAAYTPGTRNITATLYETTGGAFDQVTNPAPATVAVDTATITFASCSSAQLAYSFTGGSNAGRNGTIALVRVGPVPPSCR